MTMTGEDSGPGSAAATTVQHLTITTGHLRASARDEVSDDVVILVGEMLERALLGERPYVPLVPDGPYVVTATADDDVVFATVWGPPHDDGDELEPPIVTIGIAAIEQKAAVAWSLLVKDADPRPAILEQPLAPWCAARLEVGSALHPEAMSWLGDFERCLAWAWLTVLERRAI